MFSVYRDWRWFIDLRVCSEALAALRLMEHGVHRCSAPPEDA